MEFGVGSILDGKVTGITKFGAFVALPEGRSGLVHISEIAYSYVSEVSEYLKEGQAVKVKVIGIDQNNRINLSIKQVAPPPARNGGGTAFGDGEHSIDDTLSRDQGDGGRETVVRRPGDANRPVLGHRKFLRFAAGQSEGDQYVVNRVVPVGHDA